MVAALRHRGPDGEGQRLEATAALGHTRLAIIDRAGGAQPMVGRCERILISFNGEIYNYEALRAELASAGYPFRTHSDTEVALALYETGGIEALGRVRGMFALALWDGERGAGFLVRDPNGIKPLCYTTRGDTLAFASEAKALLAGGLVDARLDEASLHLLLNFRYLPGERTMFRGVAQVAPGEILRWDTNGVERIHLPPQPVPDSRLDLGEELADSVNAHLTADVEVGSYLSGGIDSGLVTALARRSLPYPLQTFTLAIGDDPREAANAAETARILGVVNHAEEPDDRVEHLLLDLVNQLEIPKINAVQVSLLARFAARHVKVALSGLGGDELFFGYNAYALMDRATRLHRLMPRTVGRGAGNAGASAIACASDLPWSEPERALRVVAALGDWPRVYGLLRNVWDSPALRRQVYGPRMLDRELPDAFGLLEHEWPADADPVTAAAHFERRHKMTNDLLWQEDRLAMAQGLEVRVPFVDSRLQRAVDALPRAELMPRGRLKGRLLELAAHELPSTILNRPKSGFQVNAPTFFRQHLDRLADSRLAPERVRQVGLFNPELVRRIRRTPPRKRARWHYFLLYLILMTHLWMERFEGA